MDFGVRVPVHARVVVVQVRLPPVRTPVAREEGEKKLQEGVEGFFVVASEDKRMSLQQMWM